MKFGLKLLGNMTLACALASAIPAMAQELRIGLGSNPQSADPHFYNNDGINAMVSHAYEPLLMIDGDNKLVPMLAKSWRLVNPTTWEFKLREDVKFHDGTPFTAEDVAFSLDRPGTLQNSPSPFTGFTKSIVAKKIVDPLTIQLTTATPTPLLPNDLTRIFMMSKKAAEGAAPDDFNQSKVDAGTGPFKVVKFTRGESMQLARADNYWGAKPAWSSVTLRFLPADAARMSALLAGDVQMVENVQSNLVNQFRANKDLTVFEKVSNRMIYLFTDLRDKSMAVVDNDGKPADVNPLKDVRVRQAMSKLIDRNLLVERALDKLGQPTGNLAAPGMFGFNPNLKPEPLDVAGAKKLLAEAGYPNGFNLVLSGPNDRYINDEQVLQTLGQMFTQGGIKTKVNAGPMAAYVGRAAKREVGFGLIGWGVGGGEPSAPMRVLLATTDKDKGMGVSNWTGYSSPQFDQLLTEALATTDDKKREKLLQDAAELALKKDQVLIPLYNQVATWAARKGIVYAPRSDEFTLAHQVKPQ